MKRAKSFVERNNTFFKCARCLLVEVYHVQKSEMLGGCKIRWTNFCITLQVFTRVSCIKIFRLNKKTST